MGAKGHEDSGQHGDGPAKAERKLSKKKYEKELARLQVELVKLQEWIRFKGLRFAILIEGRDAAGKGA